MTDPRVTKTRAALAQAVLALASEKPFADVTITEIAERAGVGYASFFRHYKDKDALLTAVADTMIEDLVAIIMPAMLEEDTRAASVAICAYAEAHRSITTALLSGGAETMIRHHIVARAIEYSRLQTGLRPQNPAAMTIPPELVLTHCVAATLGLLSWWLEQGRGLSAEAMGNLVDRLVMAPVRAIELE
jgi:AcrR family transcriptional regulator